MIAVRARPFHPNRAFLLATTMPPEQSIEKPLAEQEAKDSRQLEKWTRKAQAGQHLRPLQLLAVLLGIGAVVTGIGFWISYAWWLGLTIAAGTMTLCVFLYRLSRHSGVFH